MGNARYVIRWSPGTYASFDSLDPDEKVQLEQALDSLAREEIDPDADDRIQLLSPAESLYRMKLTPRLLVDFRNTTIRGIETIEVLDMVRPETLRALARMAASPPPAS